MEFFALVSFPFIRTPSFLQPRSVLAFFTKTQKQNTITIRAPFINSTLFMYTPLESNLIFYAVFMKQSVLQIIDYFDNIGKYNVIPIDKSNIHFHFTFFGRFIISYENADGKLVFHQTAAKLKLQMSANDLTDDVVLYEHLESDLNLFVYGLLAASEETEPSPQRSPLTPDQQTNVGRDQTDDSSEGLRFTPIPGFFEKVAPLTEQPEMQLMASHTVIFGGITAVIIDIEHHEPQANLEDTKTVPNNVSSMGTNRIFLTDNLQTSYMSATNFINLLGNKPLLINNTSLADPIMLSKLTTSDTPNLLNEIDTNPSAKQRLNDITEKPTLTTNFLTNENKINGYIQNLTDRLFRPKDLLNQASSKRTNLLFKKLQKLVQQFNIKDLF
jgi:hypothetical protein